MEEEEAELGVEEVDELEGERERERNFSLTQTGMESSDINSASLK